jgi:transposase-like protein
MTTAVTETTTKGAERRGRLRLVVKVAAALVVVLAAWVAYDLLAPRQTSLREFDPEEVARLDTAMWRSYYARQRARLFAQLGELLRTQYRLPFWRSNAVAYRAARAAFVFKDGRGRADYERALPDLESFYQSIRAVSDEDFDVGRAARLELEWWIVHRERKRHAPGDLERALADLAAELYRVPAQRLAEHARLRAAAMEIRDAKAEQGGVTEEDWQKIDDLLRQSWRSLHRAVNH